MDTIDKVLLWIGGISSSLFLWNFYRTTTNIGKYKEAHKEMLDFQSAMLEEKELSKAQRRLKVMNSKTHMVLLSNVWADYRDAKQKPIYIIRPEVPKEHILENIAGLPFLIQKSIFAMGLPVHCDINDARVNQDVLTKTIQPNTPNSTFWYEFLRAFEVSNLDNRYSPHKVILTLSPITMSIYGSMYFDELNNVFKMDVKFLSKSTKDMMNFLFFRKEEHILNSFINILGVALFGFIAYAAIKEFIGKRKLMPRHVHHAGVIKKEYILADQADQLTCKICKRETACILFDCCHLVVGENCFAQSRNQCPECHEVSAEHVRLFVS